MKHLFWLLFSLGLLAAAPAFAQTAPSQLDGCQYNSSAPTLAAGQTVTLQCDTSGQLKISGTINAATTVKATAAAPSYVEGSTDPISSDLSGNLRTLATSSATATAAAPSYSEGTDNAFSQDLSGHLRTTNNAIGADGSTVKTSSSLIGISDGTNQQQVVAAIALGDAVNGNNTIAAANWLWNGTTYDRQPGNTLGTFVQGNVASGTVDSGNPVKIGGKYNATLPTYTDGQRAGAQFGTRGSLNTSLCGVGSTSCADANSAAADGISTSSVGINTASFDRLFNGSSWDRLRSIVNTMNTTGTGVAAVGDTAQFDDSSPTACTENQFCPLRFSANRNLYGTIRDAAGNERGANVNSSNQLSVSVDGGSALGGVGTTGAAVPATAAYEAFNTGGNLTGSIKCQNTAIYDASTNGSTQLVALSSGKVVYVCGFNIVAGGTVNVKLIYGTGTACVTSPSDVTPAYQLTAQAGIVDDPGVYQGLNAIASNELCINTSAGVAVQAIVYYTQF